MFISSLATPLLCRCHVGLEIVSGKKGEVNCSVERGVTCYVVQLSLFELFIKFDVVEMRVCRREEKGRFVRPC